MAHQTHFSPIDYLDRRVQYYQKLRKRLAHSVNDPWMIEQHGKEELETLIAKRLTEIDSMIKAYDRVVDTLINYS